MPGIFKKWQLESSTVGNDFWTLEVGIEATKWLIEDVLQLNPEEIPKCITKQVFIDNQIGSMLHYVFDNSPFKAVDAAYPKKYSYSQFNRNRNRIYSFEA